MIRRSYGDLVKYIVGLLISIKNYIEQLKNETSFLGARLLQKLGLNSLYFWIKLLKMNVLYLIDIVVL
ncbi:unnamed protein product [Rhizophagus irregularis]|nr:unnamed protein product [Rhizophagus irregularis]